MKRLVVGSVLVFFLFTGYGCSKSFWGGAAAGVAGAGAGYEIQAKRQMDDLEEQRQRGEITQKEYEARKAQIEKGSVIQ